MFGHPDLRLTYTLVCLCVLNTAEVTTPNRFMPPFKAKNKSGLNDFEAVVIVPF